MQQYAIVKRSQSARRGPLDWNISKTAEIISTPRSDLYKKLERYGIRQEVDG